MRRVVLSGLFAGTLLFGWVQLMYPSAMAAASPAKVATMLEMTFFEFEAAVKTTDVMLLPIGAIEEHGASLPLVTDAIIATGQFIEVQRYLRARGVATIVGPALNIGLTNNTGDFARNGTYVYPGSLTVRAETFVALYVDTLRALRDNGLRRVFLFSGHGGATQQRAVAQIAEQVSQSIDGLSVYALASSENVERVGIKRGRSLLVLENYRSFELQGQLLGNGIEPPSSTHADGAEISLMLFYRPDMVRSGYQKLPQTPSSIFFTASQTGDRAANPSGTGGFPSRKASAKVGKAILQYRTALIGRAIEDVLARGALQDPVAARPQNEP
jgi:creatinine amidohydrolase